MLTPETIIDTTEFADLPHSHGWAQPNWTGTLEEALNGERVKERFDALLAEYGLADHDLGRGLQDLGEAGLADQEIVNRLIGDPNAIILDPDELEQTIIRALYGSNFSTRYSMRAEANEIRSLDNAFVIYWDLDGEYGAYGIEWGLSMVDGIGDETFDCNGLIGYNPRTETAEKLGAQLLELAENTRREYLRTKGAQLVEWTLHNVRRSLDGADWLPNYGGHEGIGYKGVEFRLGLSDDEPRIIQTWELADADEDEDGYDLPDDIAETLDGLNAEDELNEDDIDGQFLKLAHEAIETLRDLAD